MIFKRIAVLVALVFLVFVLLLNRSKTFNFSLSENKVSEVANKIPTPISYQKTALPKRVLSDSVFSPEGDFLLYLDARKDGELWNVEFTLSPQRHSFEIEGGNYKILKSWKKIEEDVREYVNGFVGTWTEDGKKFAVVVDGNLIIKGLESSGRMDEVDGISLIRSLYKVNDIVDESIETKVLRNLMFSKDGSKLFASTDSGLYQIWPEEKIIDTVIADYYPLSESDGFIYSKEEVENSGEYKFFLIMNGKKTSYRTPIENMDSVSNIMMSLDLNFVCAELSYSGHHGYSIFRPGMAKDILTGQQYSYCIKWIDNFRVMLKEIPYFHQWTTEYYLVDARTGKRELLEYFNHSDR